MPPYLQSKTGHCWTDQAHDAKCAACCHCGLVRDLPPKVVEILVNVHATRKVPGAVQYSSDERGGSVSLRAAIREGENITGTMRLLWDAAEVELEKRGLTVVKRDAEIGARRTCAFVYPGGAKCANDAGTDGRCARPDHQPDDSGRARPPSATSPTPPDEQRGAKAVISPAATSGAAPTFVPATQPSGTTPEQARAAAMRRRYDHIVAKVSKALDEKYLPREKYKTLIQLVQQELGKNAKIEMFPEVGVERLVAWAEKEGVD